MAMRCVICGRALAKAAALKGGLPVGPTCALKVGLVQRAEASRQSVLNFEPPTVGQEARPVDTVTIPLF